MVPVFFWFLVLTDRARPTYLKSFKCCTVGDILRGQSLFFVNNFAGVPNWKLGNVSNELYFYPIFRVWVPPPYPTGPPWGPHPHPPWGWGIEFEKPRGWGILTKTPWGFGGVFHAFLCFSCRKFLYFCSFLWKKMSNFVPIKNHQVKFVKKSLHKIS